jgi:hypothetical protein
MQMVTTNFVQELQGVTNLVTAKRAIGAGQGGDVSPSAKESKGIAVSFGPVHEGLKEKFMFRKTIGIAIKGYVFKAGFLIEKLPQLTYIAMVECPGEFAEETFDSAEAAIHWAQSRATWKTGIDGIEREIIVRWYRGEESGVLTRQFVEAVQVVQVVTVL